MKCPFCSSEDIHGSVNGNNVCDVCQAVWRILRHPLRG